MYIIYLRLLGIPLALIGYILYQVFIRKKNWRLVQEDVRLTSFILVVWGLVYFVLLK
jgi:hypothetical protein